MPVTADLATVIDTLGDLETGICLWIGAGVTKHVALSIGGAVPDWNALTSELEVRAGIAGNSAGSSSNPERLHACLESLGASTFRHAVSRYIYGELCVALARFAHSNRGRLAEPPQSALQLAALGWLANPIVNFNVETLTSYLVARPGGPCRILPYRDSSRGAPYEEQESSSDFWRTVYHPHGAVNYGGRAVMTAGEYHTHDGSLAYLLSVSAAFENNLWIVGMSVDDAYLRAQLTAHREQIRQVRWFNSETELRKHEAWARDARVTLVPVVWPEFWSTVGCELGPQVRRAGVMTAWSHVLTVAIQELTRGGPSQELETLARLIPDLTEAAHRATADAKATYRHVFESGEGRGLLPADFDERAIAEELRAALAASAELICRIQQVVANRGNDAGRDMASALEGAKPRLPAMRRMNI